MPVFEAHIPRGRFCYFDLAGVRPRVGFPIGNHQRDGAAVLRIDRISGKGVSRMVLTDRLDLLHDAFGRAVGLEAHRLIVAKARLVIGADIGINLLQSRLFYRLPARSKQRAPYAFSMRTRADVGADDPPAHRHVVTVACFRSNQGLKAENNPFVVNRYRATNIGRVGDVLPGHKGFIVGPVPTRMRDYLA